MPSWTKFIPVVGQLVDLGFSIADRVRARRAARRAEERRRKEADMAKKKGKGKGKGC